MVIDEIWSDFTDRGWFKSLIPNEYGGNGKGLAVAADGIEEQGRKGHFTVFPCLTALATTSLVNFGSEDLKKELLPKIADGKSRFCFGATEEDAGFNFFEMKTQAKLAGESFLVNGSKTYTSGFDISDLTLLVARTTSLEECLEKKLPKTFGVSVFIVDSNSEGFSAELLNTRGEGEAKQFALKIEDLKVPVGRMLGKVNEGANALFSAFNSERVLFSYLVLGISQFCLDTACAYANKRSVFRGQPIGAYQAIQHPLAEVKIRQEAVRQLAHKTLLSIEAKEDPAKTALLANYTKFLAAELGEKSVDAAISALGGKGFNEDHRLIQLLEGVRLLKLSPISNHLILNEVATKVLGLPRSY